MDLRLVGNFDRKGSLYFVFSQEGANYSEDCAVYLHERCFDLIQKAFDDHVADFDYYGHNALSREQWDAVIAGLLRLGHKLRTVEYSHMFEEDFLEWVFPTVQEQPKFEHFAGQLSGLIDKLVAWLVERLDKGRSISVIGL
nr:hypothetical protein Hi04_10k_c2089_00036 [uncultured bacterium]